VSVADRSVCGAGDKMLLLGNLQSLAFTSFLKEKLSQKGCGLRRLT